MSRIRGADTTPEVALRDALEAHGILNNATSKTPAGRPDIILGEEKIAIFIDGCFWHGCPLHCTRPRTREEFWSTKLITNIERDSRISGKLAEAGWIVIRLWEHEVVEDVEEAAELVARIAHHKAASRWSCGVRVRRVVETSYGIERRECVQLGNPTVVIEAVEGPRVTAKARVKRR